MEDGQEDLKILLGRHLLDENSFLLEFIWRLIRFMDLVLGIEDYLGVYWNYSLFWK